MHTHTLSLFLQENAYFCALSIDSENKGPIPDLCMQPVDLEASSSSAAYSWIHQAEKVFADVISAAAEENKHAGKK